MGPLSIEQVLAQEADAISEPGLRSPSPALHLFAKEQHAETARANRDADKRSGKDEDPSEIHTRKAFYRNLNKLNRAALCLSGGGIRSTTFCLGVIQALAMYIVGKDGPHPRMPISEMRDDEVVKYADLSLLSRFHYLSTVSGGGHLGSWLSAWRTRDDFPTVWRNLAGRPDGPAAEPAEISWLRAYRNYLRPKIDVFSVEWWTNTAIYLRNLVLNWLVIVPAAALVLLVSKIFATDSIAVARTTDALWLHAGIALISVVCLIVAQAFTTGHRPTRRRLPGTSTLVDPGNVKQNAFLYRDLLWSVASAVLLTSFLTSHIGVELVGGLSTYVAIGVGAFLGYAIFAAGWLVGRPLNWEGRDFGAWAVSGFIYGGLVAFGAHLYTLLSPYMVMSGTPSIWIILIPIIFGVPWVLISQLFAEMIFVGLISYESNSDADRNWFGRRAGWIVATAVVWALVEFLNVAGDYVVPTINSFLGSPDDSGGLGLFGVGTASGISGIATILFGKGGQKQAGSDGGDHLRALVANIVLTIGGPIFAILFLIGLSVSLDLLLLGDSLVQSLTQQTLTTEYILFWLVIGFVVTFFVAWATSYSVNVNQFSLHAIYRNRLIRTYLGASRQDRSPDQFTGFDAADNLSAHALWPPKPENGGKNGGKNTFCLFHVVNITLNAVKSARLAWQERTFESFTVSPLHCGATFKGFRPSKEYGGGEPFGLSLGTAMAISGAAANPHRGYDSSPPTKLLLALFSLRLGWWLGNPGEEGKTTYTKESPAIAIKPQIQEVFGLTTDDAPYVHLSDGGHFENLGLYEMVRRRCRLILVVDVSCDPDFSFGDLGNAVRKIFTDFGIQITFEGLGNLKNRPAVSDLTHRDDLRTVGKIPYHAIGHVHYADVDGADSKEGLILYIKPAIHFTDNESIGVRGYASENETFPHETTIDETFSESQFESYRLLGLNIVKSVLADEADGRWMEQLNSLEPTA